MMNLQKRLPDLLEPYTVMTSTGPIQRQHTIGQGVQLQRQRDLTKAEANAGFYAHTVFDNTVNAASRPVLRQIMRKARDHQRKLAAVEERKTMLAEHRKRTM